MGSLDADAIRAALREETQDKLATFEVFEEIGSTNSHLLSQPAPAPGQLCVALTDNQTAGRGRHGKPWVAPPGSGLCLSVAHAYAQPPVDLPAMTLAVGLAAVDALEDLGIGGIRLKWPNDLVAKDSKLGGILTEARSLERGAVHIVTGIGLNLDLGPNFVLGDAPDRAAIDLAAIAAYPPRRDSLAAALIERMCDTLMHYGLAGFGPLASRWSKYDWLRGRDVTVEVAGQRVTGTGAGIDDDGALLLAADGIVRRISSGTVLTAQTQEGGS